MHNAHITFLKDLLRRAEAGEVVIVDSRVSDEFQETTLEEYGGVQHHTSQPTGEQDWWFTTRPTPSRQGETKAPGVFPISESRIRDEDARRRYDAIFDVNNATPEHVAELRIRRAQQLIERLRLGSLEAGDFIILAEQQITRLVESASAYKGASRYLRLTQAAASLRRAIDTLGELGVPNMADNPYQAYTWEHIASLVPALIRARKTLVLSDDEFEQKATWARHSINTILTDPKPNQEIYTVLTDTLSDLHRELDAIGRPGL